MSDLDDRIRRGLNGLAEPGDPSRIVTAVRARLWRRRQRRHGLLAALVAVVVAGGGLAAWLVSDRRTSPSDVVATGHSRTGTSAIPVACNVHHERTLTHGRLAGHTWELTGDGSARDLRAVIVVYVDGQAFASQCVEASSWPSLVRSGPSGWSFAPDVPRPAITVLYGVIPYEVTRIQVAFQDGHTTTTTPAGTNLRLPFRYFALAVPSNKVVTGIDARNSHGDVIASAIFPTTSSGAHEPLGGTLDAFLRIDYGLVHLPLQGPQKTTAFECPRARQPLSGSPDGLPMNGQTDPARVLPIKAQSEGLIRRQFPGVVRIDVQPRNGEVWDRDAAGTVITRIVRDDWLVAQLNTSRRCPSGPQSVDGVPVRFIVKQRP